MEQKILVNISEILKFQISRRENFKNRLKSESELLKTQYVVPGLKSGTDSVKQNKLNISETSTYLQEAS